VLIETQSKFSIYGVLNRTEVFDQLRQFGRQLDIYQGLVLVRTINVFIVTVANSSQTKLGIRADEATRAISGQLRMGFDSLQLQMQEGFGSTFTQMQAVYCCTKTKTINICLEKLTLRAC
jgi:hypothetical protein